MVWKMDQAAVEAEADRGDGGRFGAGTPRISDGQLLFLQHMLGRMQDNENILTFFEREVKPHVPDAWINAAIRDHKDGEIGKVGYEINFNRYFYTYQPPRPLEEIEADIKILERDILEMLHEVAG